MKEDCQNARFYIEKCLDGKTLIPEWVENHLKICPECYRFKISLEETIKQLKTVLNDAIKGVDPPDFSIIQKRLSRRKRYTRFAQLATALVCVAILSFFGYHRYIFYKNHVSSKVKSLVKEENNLFVESLFNRSIYETTNTIQELAFTDQWFSSLDDILGIDESLIESKTTR